MLGTGGGSDTSSPECAVWTACFDVIESASEGFGDVDEVRLISGSSSGDDTRGTDISKSQGDGDSTAEAGIRCSSNECSMLTWDNVGIGATDLPSLGEVLAWVDESPLSGAIRVLGSR